MSAVFDRILRNLKPAKMRLRPTVHFTIHDESSRSGRTIQVSTLTDKDCTVKRALTDVLCQHGMSTADFEVVRMDSDRGPVQLGKTVENHENFEVFVKRKRQRTHGRPKSKKASNVTFKVVRTVIEEFVDEIPVRSYEDMENQDPENVIEVKCNDNKTRLIQMDTNIPCTSKMTVHLRVRTARPEGVELCDEYPWAQLSSAPWRLPPGTTAVQFVSMLLRRGFLHEVLEFGRADPAHPLQVGMNEPLQPDAVYWALVKEGLPKRATAPPVETVWATCRP